MQFSERNQLYSLTTVVCLSSLPDMETKRERASELEYLTWFAQNADFGPADSDVRDAMNQQLVKTFQKGGILPAMVKLQ